MWKAIRCEGRFESIGYQIAGMAPDEWAIISYFAPKKASAKEKFVGTSERMPEGFLVCSQACAEKAFDEAKECLRLAFEKLAE